MEKVRKGDVYYVLPGKDCNGSEQDGYRPAVIVSNDANNIHSGVVEIVYCTTKKKRMYLPTHVRITSIRRKCIALCEQITTVDKQRFKDYQGHLSEEEMAEIDEAMLLSLDIKNALEIVLKYKKENQKLKETIAMLEEQKGIRSDGTRMIKPEEIGLNIEQNEVKITYRSKGKKEIGTCGLPIDTVEYMAGRILNDISLYHEMEEELERQKVKKSRKERSSLFESFRQAVRLNKYKMGPAGKKELLKNVLEGKK